VLDNLAAEVFAVIVFLCDGLLQIKTSTNPPAGGATRFFVIATRLPLEVQMILCRRAVGSGQ